MQERQERGAASPYYNNLRKHFATKYLHHDGCRFRDRPISGLPARCVTTEQCGYVLPVTGWT